MALEIITACSGLGKTEHILNDIEKNKNNHKIIVLTPEQNGYNFEKSLCQKFGATFNIDVMNFNSFIKFLTKKVSLENIDIVTENLKPFYYLEVAKRLEKTNNFFVKRILQDINFVNSLDNIISEFKDYNVTIEQLENYINSSEKNSHTEKLNSILSIYKQYINVIDENNKIDKEQVLNNLLLYLQYIDLSDYIIYVDGYYNFTTQQFVILQQLEKLTTKIVISVITDIDRYCDIDLNKLLEGYSLENRKFNLITMQDVYSNFKYSLDIFRKSHEIMANLTNIIRNNNISNYKVITIYEKNNKGYSFEFNILNNNIEDYNIVSEHSIRYENSDLNYLVKEYSKITKSQISLENENINILCADTIELEMRQVARDIYKIKCDENIKDSDIAILYRDENYEKYIKIFKDYGIKVHIDKDLVINNHRLIRLIINVLNYNDDNLKEHILNILKTQLSNFENIYNDYALKYKLFGKFDVTKKQFLEKTVEKTIEVKTIDIFDVEEILNKKLVTSKIDLDCNYFIESFSNYEEEQLKIVQHIIQEIIEKINIIKKQKTVGKFINKIVDLLDYFNIKMTLDKENSEYDSIEDLQLDSVDRQIYTKFLSILHNLQENLADYKVDFITFSKILITLLNKIKYRSIPSINNFVVMSKMDLAKVENKKIIFVVGFNKDILPKNVNSNKLIDDIDKEKLIESNIFISPTSKSLLIDEEFVSYIALSRSKEKLFISYSKLDNSYKEQSPSIYLENIKVILKNLKLRTPDGILDFNINKLDRFLENINEVYTYKELNSIYIKMLRQYFNLKNDNSEEAEKLLLIINKISNELKNIHKDSENLQYEIYKDLDDKILKIEDDINSNYTFKNSNNENISEQLITKFLEKNKTFKNFSISKINDYITNPYLFFVKRILGVNTEVSYEIDALKKGIFYHAVMDNNEIINFIMSNGEKIASSCDELEQYEEEIAKINIKEKLFSVVKNLEQNNDNVRELKKISEKNSFNKYIYLRLLARLEKAIAVEIKYIAITKYNISQREQNFEFGITKNSIIYNSQIIKNFDREYEIPNITFKGTIDRIDKKDGKYLIIDYKSSQNDFKYKQFYNGEISQILSYMLALIVMFNEKEENILGVFYREIASSKDIHSYRLRGLINSDILLQEDFSQETEQFVFTRVTKKGQIHGSDIYKAYDSVQFKKLIDKNLEYILNLVEKIYKFEFFQNENIELETLYKLSLGNNYEIEKDYEEISGKQFKEWVLKL